jgi:hypothetical protein
LQILKNKVFLFSAVSSAFAFIVVKKANMTEKIFL